MKRDDIVHKRPIILSILLTVATPYQYQYVVTLMKAILYELLIDFYVAIDVFHIQHIPYQYQYRVAKTHRIP